MEKLLDEHEVAEIAKTPVSTLRHYRYRGEGGPPYVKLNRSVRYRPSDVEAWIAASVVAPIAS